MSIVAEFLSYIHLGVVASGAIGDQYSHSYVIVQWVVVALILTIKCTIGTKFQKLE